MLCLLQLCRVSHCFITLFALHCVCPHMLGCWQNFITPRPPTAAHFTAYLAWFACGITSFVAAWLFIRTVVSIGKMVRRLLPCVLCLVSCVWSLGVLYVVSVVLCPGGSLLSVDGDVPNVYRADHSMAL